MTQDLGIDGYGDADLIAQHDGTSVYRCHATRFDRDVVVKVVAGNGFDPRQFEQVARTLRTFSDTPNIARVLDAGVNPAGERYTAMEYAPRGSIADQMSAGVDIPAESAMEIAVKTARALAKVHEAGYVHGNVSPTNVLVDQRGEPLLSDIGVPATGGARTPSAAHAAPEVLAGNRPTAAADVYSLGSTIYTLLAGHEPFADAGVGPDELAEWKATHDPSPLRDHGVSERVSDIVERTMARRPTDRYASARIVAEALAQAGRYDGTDAALITEIPANVRNGSVRTPDRPSVAPVAAVATLAGPAEVALADDVADDVDDIQVIDDDTTISPAATFAPLPPALAPPPVEPSSPRRTRDDYDAARGPGKRRVLAVLAVIVVIALGVGGFAVLHGRGKSAAPATTAAPPVVHHADTALRQTFPTLQLDTTPALVAQLWATSSDRRTLTSSINVSNASLAPLHSTLRVVIPKHVAPTLAAVHFSPPYSQVVTADPKVAYRLAIPARGQFVLQYVVHFTTPLTAAGLSELATEEMHDLALDAKQTGAPAPKVVPVTLSIDPTSTTLVMTNANRQPTVTLHATESFAGVVLHDPALWKSSQPSVADVALNGVVTGYAKGTAVITATIGSVSVSAVVTVVDNTTTTTSGPRSTQPGTTAPPPTSPSTRPAPDTTLPPTTQPATTTTTAPPTTTTTAPPTTTTTTTTIPPVPANPDVNGDGVVGCLDVGLIADYLGTNNAAEDINGDGVVDNADIQADLAAYTRPNGDGTTRPDLGCPPP